MHFVDIVPDKIIGLIIEDYSKEGYDTSHIEMPGVDSEAEFDEIAEEGFFAAVGWQQMRDRKGLQRYDEFKSVILKA